MTVVLICLIICRYWHYSLGVAGERMGRTVVRQWMSVLWKGSYPCPKDPKLSFISNHP